MVGVLCPIAGAVEGGEGVGKQSSPLSCLLALVGGWRSSSSDCIMLGGIKFLESSSRFMSMNKVDPNPQR